MKILVINSGSSSIKCQYFIGEVSKASLFVERIGEESSHSEIFVNSEGGETHTFDHPIKDHHDALQDIFSMLKKYKVLNNIEDIDAVGHRVVHGGSKFSKSVLIGHEVIKTINSLIPLAPLHNTANLEGIEIFYNEFPDVPQVAVFDTAFHQSMPEHSYLYPIPYNLSKNSEIRRYGFHGSSLNFISKECAKMMGKPLEELNLILLHLGNGASITAVKNGKSIDTSMGMTPLAGLMMGTRSGDIDPAIIPYLEHHNHIHIWKIDNILNKRSGLKGICKTNDMRMVTKQAHEGDERSQLALDMYIHRIKKYIGSYTVILEDVDAIVFSGGVGENSSEVRKLACEGLYKTIQIELDQEKNNLRSREPREIHSQRSSAKVFVIPTNEELEIVRQTEAIVSKMK